MQFFGSAWRSLLLPAGPHDRGPNAVLETYGYFGAHPLLLGYLGVGMVATLVVGLAWFHRDLRLWFCAALLLALEGLSLGAAYWPWRLVDHLPLVADVVPDRVAGVADLFAAVMLGVIVDRAHGSGLRWPGRSGDARPSPSTLLALGLAALALVPIAVEEQLPFTTRPIDVPAWFTTVGPHLPPTDVVLTYPFASSGLRAPMTWQAATGLPYALVGGGSITPDPPAHPSASQRSDARATLDLVNVSDGYLPLPTGSAAESARLRLALHDWGVTTIVVPSERGWPTALRGRSVPVAVGYLTAALGAGPTRRADAWVWSVPSRPGPALAVSADGFVRCTTTPAAALDPGVAASCLLAAAADRR